MRNLFLIASFSFVCVLAFGQEKPIPVKPQEEIIYDVVDEAADFPGGKSELKKYMADNLKYPETAKEKFIEGQCFLQFVVNKNGYTSNVRVKKGVTDCPECDVEAVRMVKGMPKWAPGKINGKPVNSVFNLTVPFKPEN